MQPDGAAEQHDGRLHGGRHGEPGRRPLLQALLEF